MTEQSVQLMRRFEGSHRGTTEESRPLRRDTSNLTTRRHMPKNVNRDKQNLF